MRASSNKPLPLPADTEATPVNSSKRSRRLSSIPSAPPPEPVTATEMPLPDGLLNKLRSSNWSERFDGVTELEEFVNDYPKALGPHLLKVHKKLCFGSILILRLCNAMLK